MPDDFKENEDFILFDCSNYVDVQRGLAMIRDKGNALTTIVACVGDGSYRPDDIRDSWEFHLQTNLLSQVFLIESALELFSKSITEIIVISSIVGLRAISDAPIQYSVSKAALEHYVKVKSLELAPLGISINSVAPGNILFPGSSWDRRLQQNPSNVLAYIESTVPMKKFGSVSEIANTVDFLTHHSSFITGQTIVVDGGQTL